VQGAAEWLVAAVHAGWIGVQLFFVLSGFLITRNLLDSRGSRHYYSAFYARRLLRIVPLAYLLLIAFLVILPRFVALPAEVTDTYAFQFWVWAFLNNWVQSSGRTVYWFSHYWSLAVEEQFYVAWPVVVAKFANRWFAAICVGLVIVAIASRTWMLAAGASNQSIYNFTNSRMDALAIGALAAVVVRSPARVAFTKRFALPLLATAVIGFVALALTTGGFALRSAVLVVPGYSLLAVVFALFLLVAMLGGPGRVVGAYVSALSCRPLQSVGKYSYAMYLFHQPLALGLNSALLRALKPAGVLAPVLFALSVTALSYGCGFVSYNLFEKHVLALKRFFPP